MKPILAASDYCPVNRVDDDDDDNADAGAGVFVFKKLEHSC